MKRRKGTYNKLHAVVAPRKKTVSVFFGNKLLKTYKFSMDIPFERVEKEVHGYDYGAWSVSDRDFTTMKTFTVWDEKVMAEIREKTLQHYQLSTSPVSREQNKEE